MSKNENEFAWRKISDKEREEISKRAKEILTDFSKKLEKVEKEIKDIDVGVERDDFERNEGTGKIDESFDRDLFFENAPNKDKKKGVIIAEKKKW
ncbi:hypothetical protein COU57_01675 [Candidatus Pacearchaeota archaeon CG10_big_fil_rev_8_21_14_0_10_32_14]|nr:MAG: hypothetical protein COU57_01675 [Candidatus Pacearchaeota archaeon CG10_big_fil_rev_8_21_14_0_10_32_14]